MKYRKKPVVIEAVKFEGFYSIPPEFRHELYSSTGDCSYFIRTLEGDMKVEFNDWIIKGVMGEFYPCKPDIFEMTYEAADKDET